MPHPTVDDPDEHPTPTRGQQLRDLPSMATRIAAYVATAGVVALVYLLIGSVPGWRWAGWAAVGWAFAASALLSARFRDIWWLAAAVGAFVAIDAAPRWLFPAASVPGTPWAGDTETTAWMLGAMAAGFGAWLGGSARERFEGIRARLRRHP